MIPLTRATTVGDEAARVQSAIASGSLAGPGEWSRRCEAWIERSTGCARAMLVPSCTHALELAAMLLDLGPGDEVIVPSFTFTSTASAFALRGATVVFVDVRADTMNLDEELLRDAIGDKTRAIVPVHYAGISCEMGTILALARERGVAVVEDAAQAVGARTFGDALGALGELGTFSFHATKNVQCGEGGALLINDSKLVERAEILRDKGTDRARFLRGVVDRYSWQLVGSSMLLGELPAAYLSAQLEASAEIARRRSGTFREYAARLGPLERAGVLSLPAVPRGAEPNGHIFYVKARDRRERDALSLSLREAGVASAFHYVPLHSSPAGVACGRLHGEDAHTTRESERLLRLPLFDRMAPAEVDAVVRAVGRFYSAESLVRAA